MSIAEKLKSSLALERKALQLQYSFDWGVDIENRVVRISGDIETGFFDFLDAALCELESQSKGAIVIRINSPGGEVYEALGMAARIRACKRQIVTEGYGHIMSAATLLLASGDKRKMSHLAHFMHHEASYGLEGSHSYIKNEVEQADREHKQWATTMEELTGTAAKFWLTEGIGRNAYFDADTCRDLGIVDEIF